VVNVPGPAHCLWVSLIVWAASCVQPAPIDGAACDRQHPCPGTYHCSGGTCRALESRPASRCYDDSDCVVGVCLEALGFCVQCAEDADCGGPTACLEGAYVCGCASAAHCATGRCDAAAGVCLGCFANEQCESRVCDLERGVCKEIDEAGSNPEENAGGPR